MEDSLAGRTKRHWNAKREGYVCRDGSAVRVPRRSASVRNLGERKVVPRNWILYARYGKTRRLRPSITVSGVELDINMEEMLGGSDGIRTIIFPEMVTTVRQGAFYGVKSLRSAVLNEDLVTVGTSECTPDGDIYPGAFQESGLRRVRLQSALKAILPRTFKGCKSLRAVDFPEELRYIGEEGF